MAFDPRWLSPQLPPQPPNLSPNVNPNHQQPLSYYNFEYPNPSSETTATTTAEVTVPQQHYFYQHEAEVSGIPNASVANAGQYYYGGESVPEIPPITSISALTPPIIPQEWNDAYRYKAKRKNLKKEAKIVQPLHCAVCKINCNTQAVLDSHKQGKQHKKNLQKLKDAITPKPEKTEPEKNETENMPEKNLECVKSKPRPVQCKVCNVDHNTEEFLRLHEAGKKHKKMATKFNAAATNTNVEGDRGTKSNEPAYCQMCSVLCTSQEDLNNHYQGKNHKKKLKLKDVDNINLEGGQTEMTKDENRNQMKRKGVEESWTNKKRKVFDERHILAMRCDICNVEVNSQIVYESHITGSKHAAMVKKLQQQH